MKIFLKFLLFNLIKIFKEDVVSSGAFNYLKSGFRLKPTSFYARPMWIKKLENDNCNGRPLFQTFFDLIESFLRRMNNNINQNMPYFSFNIFDRYTHDFLTVRESIDARFKKLLETFEGLNFFDNTLLIVHSDHGNRFKAYSAYQPSGRMERKYPFLSMRLPKKLWNTSYYYNAKQNERKLIGAYDIYQTLRHFKLMNTQFEKELDRSQFSVNDKYTRYSRGISLFERIPVNRSCEDALVPHQFCLCFEENAMSILEFEKERNMTVSNVTKFILIFVNNLIKNVTDKCKEFQFDKVNEIRRYNIDSRFAQYKFIILLQPGDALFEVLISVDKIKAFNDKNLLKVLGNVVRLNKYGHQSFCINDKFLERFCYCKNFKSEDNFV